MILDGESPTDKCRGIHEILESLPEYTYKTPNSELPTNGIYFFYEEGEFCTHGNEGQKRIVRVGTHRGDENFRSRINNHYRGNKNSSVFRKHLGGALMRRKDPDDRRLKQWLEQDAPTFQEMEAEVTKELKGHFSFRCIPVEDKKERLQLEEELIATIAKCDKCKPSENWLGNFSADELVRKSGLWNHQHVTSENVITEESIERIGVLASKNSKEIRALFLIPCCSKKTPDGDNPPWKEVHSNQKFNDFQFLDDIRLEMINFYSKLSREDAFDFYKNRGSGDVRDRKVIKAWQKNLGLREGNTMPAIDRYHGKLYSSLNPDVLNRLRNGKTNNVLIVSALMGIISPTDLIPDYELMMSDKSPKNRKVWVSWREIFAIEEIRQPLQKIFSEFDHIYCLMSTTTGYVDSVATLLSDYTSYCIIPQESGQTNKLRSWGNVLSEVLLNDYNSPDEVRKVAETYNCKMVELDNRKTPIYQGGHQKIRLPFNSEKVVPIQKPKELGGVKMSKYYGIEEHLRKSQKQIETLSYDEIERILGFSLPASAHKHRAWWSNDRSGGHSHANAWLNAGWEVSSVTLGETIIFRKVGEAKSPEERISMSREAPSSTTPEIGIEDIPELIRELSTLRDDEIITKEDFERKKRELLDRL